MAHSNTCGPALAKDSNNGVGPCAPFCKDPSTGSYCGNATFVSQGVQLLCATCVCVVGGGNIAGATAAWLGRHDKNLCVHVLTRQPEQWIPNIRVRANPLCRWRSMEPFETNIQLYVIPSQKYFASAECSRKQTHLLCLLMFLVVSRITSDPKAAVSNASLVIIAAPAHVHLELLEKIAPYLKPGCILGTAFGQGRNFKAPLT